MFDENKAKRTIAFINALKHTKGKWRGVPFELLPWQETIINDVFGTVKADGYRQYNTAYIEIPKKMGKSELAAGVALYLTCGDNEWGAEVYGCASDRQQASIVFDVAGDMVEMSPTAMMMIHNPSMLLYGEAAELEQGIDFLNEVKEAIINAYQIKTGLSRNKISNLMDAETWMNARSALDMGFCDRVLYTDHADKAAPAMVFDKKVMVTNTISAMRKKLKPIEKPKDKPEGIPAEQFEKRLNLLKF